MRKGITFDTGEKTAHLEIGYAHPNALCSGSPGRILKVAKYLTGVEAVEGKDIASVNEDDDPQQHPYRKEAVESDRKLVTVHGEYKGVPITAFSTGMGPGSVSATMPEVVEICYDDDMIFYRLGTSGGLNPKLELGDFILTTEADVWEITSAMMMGYWHWVPGLAKEGKYEARANRDALQALHTAATDNKLDSQNVHQGRTIVTADLYVINDLLKQRYQGDPELFKVELPGRLAISMEFSAICAVRDKWSELVGKKIRAGNLLSVSDLPLADEERVDQSEYAKIKGEVEERQIISGLEALVEMRRLESR